MNTLFCEIESIAFGGDGVAHTPKTLFVPFTAPGDKVEVELTQDKKSFARGRLKTLISPGPDRTEPRCPYFGRCGGCQLQHLTYEAQLRAKKQMLKDALQRIAKRSTPITIHGATQQWEYRRHITLHTDGQNIGYYSTDNTTILDIDACPLYGPEFQKKPGRQLKSTSADLLGLQLEASPHAFLQAHPEMSEKLYSALLELAQPFDSALDLYCGIGATTLLLTRAGIPTHGVDLNKKAISLARKNAQINNLPATFSCSDAAKALPTDAPLLIVNPPRTGLNITGPFPRDILYISCMPSTLARDLTRLPNYTIQSAQAFDLFPQTTHLETLLHLHRP